MSGDTIEILGQKFSYPSSWPGAFAILVIGLCIAFVVYSLDEGKINSWSKIFNGTNEKAYNDALATIANQHKEIQTLKSTISDLTSNTNLSSTDIDKLQKSIEDASKLSESSLSQLSSSQAQRETEWIVNQGDISVQQQQEQRRYFSMQQELLYPAP